MLQDYSIPITPQPAGEDNGSVIHRPHGCTGSSNYIDTIVHHAIAHAERRRHHAAG